MSGGAEGRGLLLRRSFLALPLLVAACAEQAEAPPEPMPPLRYGYLTKLRLNVGTIDIEDQSMPTAAGDLALLSPDPPAQALRQMAQDRLVAAGSTGRAVFIIEHASILEGPGGELTGSLAVRLDIAPGSGAPTAYAEARVSRILADYAGGRRQAVYDITRQMMNDMNVEFEYQVRHSLKDWLQETTPISTPTPVQQEQLSPPP